MKNDKIDLEFKIEFSTKIDSYLEPVLQKVINQIGKNIEYEIKNNCMWANDPRDGVEYKANKPKLVSWYCKAKPKNDSQTNPKT